MACERCDHLWYGATSKGSGFTTWWCRLKKQRMAEVESKDRKQIAFPVNCDEKTKGE